MPVEEVRYCSACRCKTWHVDEHCEWEDGHKSAGTMGKADWSWKVEETDGRNSAK